MSDAWSRSRIKLARIQAKAAIKAIVDRAVSDTARLYEQADVALKQDIEDRVAAHKLSQIDEAVSKEARKIDGLESKPEIDAVINRVREGMAWWKKVALEG